MNEKLLLDLSARGVATLTLNRPDSANTYDQELLDRLGDALERIGADASVRVLVLRGAGRHFSGGGDQRRHENAPLRAADAPPPLSALDIFRRLRALPQPTIAAIQGACLGGALGFAACCDIRIAADSAFFAMPEVRLGFCADTETALVFIRAIGPRNYRRFGMTGQRFNALEALQIGLVHQVCAPVELDPAIDWQIEEILLAAPGAARKAKQMADALEPPVTTEMLAALRALGGAGRDTPEAREGMAAFKDKRKPAWYPPKDAA